jgi:glycosyltransferase involved in cell wall biosynthesis
LAAGDAFLFPSIYEAFGLALVEAMNAKLAVVTSDLEVFREIVDDAGIRVSLNDQEGWVRTIQAIMTPSVRRDLGLRAAERGKRKEERGKRKEERGKIFGFESMCDQFEVILSENGTR